MKTKKALKITLIALATLLAIIIGYLLYVVIGYYRVEDNLQLKIDGAADGTVPVNTSLTLVTYNIGFGAYSNDYSFFMDGGEHSRAFSREAVIQNTNGALSAVKNENPDFVVFQEVDVKGTRSYKVDQTALLCDGFVGYSSTFAQNYDSPYFLYPFNEPIGANKSGVLTLSKYKIASAHRRSLPIENSFYKYLDLDRAYSVSVIPADSGKNLVLYNVHLSAYTSDGTISADQLKMLSADMAAELQKGNYVIAAGDFNKDMLGDSSKFFKREEGEFNWAKPFETELLPEGISVYSGQNAPSCRNADSAFRADGTDFVLSVDGALISNNIKVIKSETVDVAFKFSDHNPVKIVFELR